MLTFIFCSFKGGTAKTSTALHIGACLSKYHSKRVLLVDFDPQANLSTGLGIGPDNLDTIVAVLQGQKKAYEVIRKTSVPNLDIIPANVYLDGIEAMNPLATDLYAHERLRKSLLGLDYDFCFIDTPPSLGWLTQSAFFAGTHSVICAVPEPYSILALHRLKDYHASIQENHPVSCFGVVMSFWDQKGSTNEAFLGAIESSFPGLIFKTKVRRDVAVSRAILQGKPVMDTDEKSRASQDYQSLCSEFISRLVPQKAKDTLASMMNQPAGVSDGR
jgi:chromosome partitioning protein